MNTSLVRNGDACGLATSVRSSTAGGIAAGGVVRDASLAGRRTLAVRVVDSQVVVVQQRENVTVGNSNRVMAIWAGSTSDASGITACTSARTRTSTKVAQRNCGGLGATIAGCPATSVSGCSVVLSRSVAARSSLAVVVVHAQVIIVGLCSAVGILDFYFVVRVRTSWASNSTSASCYHSCGQSETSGYNCRTSKY